MANQEKQHLDADRVLIWPSTCSTFVVKKSSVGHVPHEPSKGAVGYDVCHSAVPFRASTAAHGGLRITAKTKERKQKPSVSSRSGELGDISPAVQYDASQTSLFTQGHVSVAAADNSCHVIKSAMEECKTNDAHPVYRETARMSKSVHMGDLSSTASLSDLVENDSATGLFHGTLLNHADTVKASSTSGNVEMLETEVMSLREQLVIQSKVNADLKKLLVASIGDDLQHKVDALVRTKIQLANEIDDYTKKLLEDYEDLDKLTIQADIWHSKYKASRLLEDQLRAELRQLSAAYSDAVAAVRQMLADSREMHTLLMHTHTTLEALRSRVVMEECAGSGPCLTAGTQSSLELARVNRRIVDEVCIAVLRTLPSHAHHISSQSCLSPSELLAYKVLNDCNRMSVSRPSDSMSYDDIKQHRSRQLHFHPCMRHDGVTFSCCRKCRGDVHVV